jgi:hypothetical protein
MSWQAHPASPFRAAAAQMGEGFGRGVNDAALFDFLNDDGPRRAPCARATTQTFQRSSVKNEVIY